MIQRALPLFGISLFVILWVTVPVAAAAEKSGAAPAVARESTQLVAKFAAGLPPEQAAQKMTVPDGFHVTLAAGEPQVHQPIAMAIDERGRVWVAEAYTYPIRAPEGQGKDKIIILEDTTGDGRLDSQKVFIEGLNLVSGLEVGFGGVWVGAAPYLMFIPDKDRDDRPDGPAEILLDGFGYQDTHETLNAFIWGPDGWLYGCHGVFTHSRVGRPGTPSDQRTPLNAGVWRYHPQRHQFEVFAWGTSNPWGVDFNDHGQAFITACVIPHLYYVVQGARYERQGGQHFNAHVYDDIKTIADHRHYAGNIRDHAWWGHDVVDIPHDTSSAGGGHAHCGCMIYLGDNWPDRYRNSLLVCNIHGNRVNNEILEVQGSGFVGKHGPDFLFANDHWFRGINLRYGPDGTVYLIDWYDRNACHRTNPEIWDRTNGRVYNIRYGQARFAQVDLAALSDAELVQMQLHRNEWYVRMSRRILQDRGGSVDVHTSLWRLFADQSEVARKLRALWTLHVTDGIRAADTRQLLQHDEESVRAWAIQLALEGNDASEPLVRRLVQMAREDESPRVRLYLASALQRLPLDMRWEIAAGLVHHEEDSRDHNLPLMVWYGIEPLVLTDPPRALALGRSSKIPLLTRYILRRAASDPQRLALVVNELSGAAGPAGREVVLREILGALEGRAGVPVPENWPVTYQQLVRGDSDLIRDLADRVAVALGDASIFPRMRQRLVDHRADMAKRKQALEILIGGRDPGAAESLRAVLDEPPLRGAALRALAAYDESATPKRILQLYGELDETERRDAIHTLCARPAYARQLMAALSDGTVPRKDVHAYDIRQIMSFGDDEIRKQIQETWGVLRETSEDKRNQIATLRSQLADGQLAQADRSNGRRLFDQNCATCHTLFGNGDQVGPDLTGSNRANVDYLLDNVVDPSSVLGNDYRLTMLDLEDGRVVSGLVMRETDSALTVRTVNDTVVIPKSDVDERNLVEKSVMPDGLLDQLEFGDIRDLVAYLGSPVQVAPRGPRAPLDPETGRVSGAIEGEAIKVLAKKGGDTSTQDMGGFSADRWSGDQQLWWTGAAPGASLELELPVAANGQYDLEIVLTKARDYGVVQLSIDEAMMGGPIDLFDPAQVVTTGVLTFSGIELSAGKHRVNVEIVGAHPAAVKSYMFGLDYVRLAPAEAVAK